MGLFDMFKKPINDEMKEGETEMRRGLEADSRKEYDKALEHFTKSIEIADYIWEVYSNRGAVYQKLDRFLDARDDYNKAIQLGGDLSVQFNLDAIQNWCDYADKNSDIIKNLIQKDGIEFATKRFAEVITEKMHNSYDDVYYFILEEIQELREYFNNSITIMFILKSGIKQSEYLNLNSDKTNQSIQDEALNLSKSIYCCLSKEPDIMLKFRISLIDQIMKQYQIGKYNKGD